MEKSILIQLVFENGGKWGSNTACVVVSLINAKPDNDGDLSISMTVIYHDLSFKSENSPGIEKIVLDAISTTVKTVLNFIVVSSCTNVKERVIEASVALNKKRIAKKKKPFFNTRVLMVHDRQLQSSIGGSAPQNGTHARPVTHLRRGHPRRLPSGNIWINAMVINGNSGDAVKAPTYRMKRV